MAVENGQLINVNKYMEMGDDIKRKINELLQIESATTKALDVIAQLANNDAQGG